MKHEWIESVDEDTNLWQICSAKRSVSSYAQILDVTIDISGTIWGKVRRNICPILCHDNRERQTHPAAARACEEATGTDMPETAVHCIQGSYNKWAKGTTGSL
jgi:hypothetical protein